MKLYILKTRVEKKGLTFTVPPISLQLVVRSTLTLEVVVAHVHTLVLASAIEYQARFYSLNSKRDTRPPIVSDQLVSNATIRLKRR